MDKLEAAMSDFQVSDLKPGEIKECRIEIRTSLVEKVDIQRIAGSHGISVAEYLLRLHRYARSKLVVNGDQVK